MDFHFHNPRDYASNRHKHVDDSPYGGGPGMIIQVEPVLAALRAIKNPGHAILLNPSGRQFSQKTACQLSREKNVTLVCGRYEGFDHRLQELFPLDETSIGDIVLNGGETAALAIIESVCRFLPGFLGKAESAATESFSDSVLEYPQYTRPEKFESLSVPPVLINGDHAKIAEWRRAEALKRTLAVRPDLLARANLGESDAKILAGISRTRPGRNISFCLFHYPVHVENNRIGVSSLTNLDIHDIARISISYGMGNFYVLTPLVDQLNLLNNILRHWLNGECRKNNIDRRKALELVQPVDSFEKLDTLVRQEHGQRPLYIATSASWPGKKNSLPLLAPEQVLECGRNAPVVICLGTAKGLALERMDFFDGQLRPLRFLDENHLSVRSAAAILADRILGDFY